MSEVTQERLLKVLLASHVSEKATLLADKANQHVFRVLPDASKTEIKRAVEQLFDVRVTSVRVSNMRGKQKKTRSIGGRRPNWKKAYVKLAAGDDIKLMDAE